MSLLVWLPLNGDLRNNGLAETSTISTANLSFAANGKIGKCMSGYTGFFSVPSMANKKQLSVAYWVRINTATATNWLDAFTWYSTDGTTSQVSRNEFYTNSTYTGFWFAGPNSISGKKNTVGAWQHHAFVIDYSAGTSEFFINGVSVGKTTGVYTTHYLTGNNFRIGENGLDASYNDFRLYDHVLSDREVKELSKGLVAHWKLDDPYVEETTNLVTSSTTGSRQITRVDDTLVTSGENKDTYFRLSLGAALVAGTTYTVSMYCRGMADGGTATFGVGAQSGDNRATLWTVQNGHNECTFIVPTGLNGATSIMFDDTNRVGLLDHQAVFSQIQVERKDHATGYIAWGTSRAKGAVCDSSGYCHDGTLSPTPPTFDSDSARYSGCMKFSSNYIHCGLSSLYPTDEITVAWWGYMDSWSSYGRAISCTETGGWNFEPNSRKIRFVVYKKGVGYGHALSETTLANLSSGWHHFVGTFDGYVAKIYVDGEYENVSTDASPEVKAAIKYQGNVPIYIGCEANGANPSSPYFNGKLSDIRIYVTALSAEDIKELYNTSASIDDHHNVYARELVED